MLSEAESCRIAAFLDVTTLAPMGADLIMVFGTRLAEPAEIAARLYAKGVAAYIALTGGTNRITGLNEAEAHLALLLEHGVPRDRIIVENRSTNTLENVVYALPLIDAVLPLGTMRAIVAVAKWYHSRRALMTLRQHLPAGITYYAATYAPEGISRATWAQMRQGELAVLKEAECIPRYLAAGHIAEVHGDARGYH